MASFFFFLGPPLRFIMAGDGESMLCYVVLGCYIFQWCSGAPEGLSGGGGSIPKVFRRHPVVAPSPQLLSSPIRRRSAQLERLKRRVKNGPRFATSWTRVTVLSVCMMPMLDIGEFSPHMLCSVILRDDVPY